MRHKHLLATLGILATLFASCRVVFSLETWHNCSTSSCKSFFTFATCQTTSACQCGVTTNQSTCGIDPATIANQTDATGLNTSQGQLSCCMCESNYTFCCGACEVTTTPVASTTTTITTTIAPTTSSPTTTTTTTSSITITTTIAPTTSSPPVEQAILVAIFILNHDIATYSSRTQQLSLSFRYAVGNLTSTDNSLTDVAQLTFHSGVRPYCGFQVTPYVNNPNINSNQVQCRSMVMNATIKKDDSSSRSLASIIKLITDSVNDGSFGIKLWDGSQIKASFSLSKLVNSSYVFHRGPYEVSTDLPTKTVPPIHTNLWPLIYSAIGVFSLIALCIIWQCCKQSYLLRKKKYTDINSDRLSSRKKKLQDAMSNQESTEKEPQRERGMFDMTHNKIQQVDNEALTRRYDWTTPAYLPNMLAPAYAPTELHGQHSPPRLMLDDDDSDSDKKSLGKSSVINVDEETDEDLKDILESEDEDDVFKERTSTRQSYTSQKKPASTLNKRKPSTTSKASKTSNSTRNTSAKSTAKIPNSALGQVQKSSYSGPEGRERTPSLGFGNLKSNRITPVSDERKSKASSGKSRKKKESSNC